jgi:hypothetical protein
MAMYDEVRQKRKDIHVMAPEIPRKDEKGTNGNSWADN